MHPTGVGCIYAPLHWIVSAFGPVNRSAGHPATGSSCGECRKAISDVIIKMVHECTLRAVDLPILVVVELALCTDETFYPFIFPSFNDTNRVHSCTFGLKTHR